MANTTKAVISSYVDTAVGFISGNVDKTTAASNQRKIIAAVKGQISTIEEEIVDAEEAIIAAKEAYNKAFYSVKKSGKEDVIVAITDKTSYLQDLSDAESNIKAAEAHLESLQESLTYNQGLLDKVSSGQ